MKPKYTIVHSRPLFFPVLKLIFPGIGERTIVTFGRRIYIPDGLQFAYGTLAHEEEHVRQQRGSYFFATIFLIRYILSRRFRYCMELEAYRAQWKHIKEMGGHELVHREVLKILASELSGPMYGNLVSRSEAIGAIRDIQQCGTWIHSIGCKHRFDGVRIKARPKS